MCRSWYLRGTFMPHCPTVEGRKARKHIYHIAEFTVSKSYMKHQFIHGGRALWTSAPLIRPHLLTLLEWELIQTTANAGNKSSMVYSCRQLCFKRLCAKGDINNLKTKTPPGTVRHVPSSTIHDTSVYGQASGHTQQISLIKL